MIELWMLTGSVLALGIAQWTSARRIRILERQVSEWDKRLEVLEIARSGNRLIKETDWLPPSLSQPTKAAPMPTYGEQLVMKHKEIKS